MAGKLRPRLSLKQIRFAREYAQHGNGTEAARAAGYSRTSENTLAQQASDNIRKPQVIARVQREIARLERDFTPDRVQRRLDEIGREAQVAGQFGPAVRAEELIGKSIGMWVDQSLQLTGALTDAHVTALLELAKRRQAEPIDLVDDTKTHNRAHDD